MMSREKFDDLYKEYPLVHGNPSPDQLYWLVQKVSEINPHTILEIGVMQGASLKLWEQVLSPDDLLIGLDNRADLYRIKCWDWDVSDREVKVHGDDSRNSLDMVKKLLGDRKIDFLYIDGWHEDYIPHSDFGMYAPLVRVGGIVGFAAIDILDCEQTPLQNQKLGTRGSLFRDISIYCHDAVEMCGSKGIWKRTTEYVPLVQ